MEYLITAETDIGNKKNKNQDSLIMRVADSPYGNVFFGVICDGLGGYEKGELASAAAVMNFAKWFHELCPAMLSYGIAPEALQNSMNEVVQKINYELYQYGQTHGIYLGTTISAILMLQDQYYIIHVGDCRIYEIKDSVRCLTRDQTVLERDLAAEGVQPASWKGDSRQHILLQCVGMLDKVKPSFYTDVLKKDAIYLMCSDGFYHEVTEAELFTYLNPKALRSEEMMQHGARMLIDLNMERMESDNITAALVRTYGGTVNVRNRDSN